MRLFALLLALLLLPASASAGGKASDFTLKDLNGANVSLSDFLGKKVILVSFWATWCAPCLKEMPHLDQLQNELGASVRAALSANPRLTDTLVADIIKPSQKS